MAAAMSKNTGASTSTRKRGVIAMSWIIIGSSTPSTVVGPRTTSPKGPMADQVRYGGSRP